jgi:hypothetical protein
MQFLVAERSGEEAAIIDELHSKWRSVLTTLLQAYSMPGNWKGGRPCAFIPRDIAAMLAHETDARAAAEAELAAELRLARSAFDEDRNNGGSGQIGVCATLNATLKFMQATRPHGRGSLLPLSLLAAALGGLAKGLNVDPMLLPKPKGKGRRSAPPVKSLKKQLAAVLISMLLDDETFCPEGGRREDAANDYVRRKLKLTSVSSATLGNWRSEVTSHLRGFGVPGKADKAIPDPRLCKEAIRLYADIWRAWKDLKGRQSAVELIDRIVANSNIKTFARA